MGAGELQVAAKLACIGVAAEGAKLGNRLNQSRIAAATGLTRKEVRNLAGLIKSGRIFVSRAVSKQRTTRVLHGWRTDPEFLDRRGNPSRLTISGPGATFHTLVRRYGGDVTPVSVLNELARSGAVSRIARGRVSLCRSTPRMRGFGVDVVTEITSRLRDFGTTLVNNVEYSEDPIFVAFCDIQRLSEDEVALFYDTFSERAAALVDGVKRWRNSQARIRTKVTVSGAEDSRVGLGVYLIGPQHATAPPAGLKAPRSRISSTRAKR
jgi:hypothetical protein